MSIYKIADTFFEIESIYDEVHKLCAEYKSEEIPEFTLLIEQKDIDFEREKSKRGDIKEGIPVRNFSDSYLETLAVYRKLCEILIDKGGSDCPADWLSKSVQVALTRRRIQQRLPDKKQGAGIRAAVHCVGL